MQYRRIATFVYILLFLLSFNLFFNLNFQWYGISLIVRVYLFIFSFYLIFNYSAIEIGRVKELYRNKFGKKGELFLLFEMGLVPLIIIYGVTIVFTLIDYLRLDHWPWNPILSLLNGRYSNLVIYSLFLFLILKTKRGPGTKIAIFIGVSLFYFSFDKLFYSLFFSGLPITAIKVAKLVIISFFLFYAFLGERNKLKSLLYSSLMSFIILFSIVSIYVGIFNYSKALSYQKREAGLVLLRFGFDYPLEVLKEHVFKTNDIRLLKKIFAYSHLLNRNIRFDDAEWERLLLSGSLKSAEIVASYIANSTVPFSYDKVTVFAEKELKKSGASIENLSHFIALTTRIVRGHENEFIKRISESDTPFRIFGITVLGELKEKSAMPLLIDYLVGMDSATAEASYESLKKISGIDPAGEMNKAINNPDVIIKLKEHFLLYRTNR